MKGQSAMEFLSMVSMSALILALLYGLVATKQADLNQYKRIDNAEHATEQLSYEIEMALVQGEGYSRVFYLDEKIGGRYYNISVGHTNVLLETEAFSYNRNTLYRGEWINVSTKESNIFRVYNNGSVVVENAG